jgi:hypothetical protein
MKMLEARRERAELSFLHGFARDLSAQIERDNRIHIEYVPTQVVSEYLRRVFRDANGSPLTGSRLTRPRLRAGAMSCCSLARNSVWRSTHLRRP